MIHAVLLLITLINPSLSGYGSTPTESECCKAMSSSWYRYNRELMLDDWCETQFGQNYHLPQDALSYDAELAKECLSDYQQRRISNGANGYLLMTQKASASCYANEGECRRFMMVCIKNGELISI